MAANIERCPLCGSELSGVKFKEIQDKLRYEEREKAAEMSRAETGIRLRLQKEFERSLEEQRKELERKVQAEAQSQVRKIAAERDLAARKLQEAEAREATVRKQVGEAAEKERAKDLSSQRQLLEMDKKQALLKQQGEFNRQREALQGRLLQVEKQLQKKTANELGEGAEIDLYEVLREHFATDKITRVPKGQPGADIRHEVMYKGVSCGRIIIDSKNRQGWKWDYVTKLRQDQTEEGAEHAILATPVFPAGKKELCIESGVILVSPARVVYVVQLLRNAMVTMHIKGLSFKERSTKMTQLYKLITSESYARKFGEASKLATEILELDVEEKKTHDNVWKKRGSLAKRVQNVIREVETEVSAVIEGAEEDDEAPAFSVTGAAAAPVASRAGRIA
jgi:hypothetical protein